MKIETNKLDNPVWNSLSETHKKFSIAYNGVKFYLPAYCPFGGFRATNNIAKDINDYAQLTNYFYIVGEKPQISNLITLNKNLICNQMLLEQSIDIEITEPIVELKTEIQQTDLSNLVNLVQPGFFKNKTSDLGKYFGIYKNDKLIAAAGERMKMKEFTEVSAIVTHPDHTRKGYAKQLIKTTTDQIFSENKTPYLHVTESNIGAINLYKKLGFSIRRKMSFWNLKTNN